MDMKMWRSSAFNRLPCLWVLGLLLLVSCGDPATPLGHDYVRRGEHIHFEGGSTTGENGGTRIDEPSEANVKGFERALGRKLPLCRNPDAASFEPLSEEYCRDLNTVYYKWISPGRFLMVELPGADAESFRALNFVYAVDANSVWYQDQAIAGSDPGSFVVLNNRVGKDGNAVYVSGERVPHLDADSFRHLAEGYYADKNGVYWGTDRLANADPETFEVLGDSFIAKDKDHVYRSGRVIDGLDAATTKLLLHDPYGYQFISDRNGVYVNGLKFLHADPADFKMRDNRCATGGRHLFFVDVYHSTPVTMFCEGEDLIAETILYDRQSREGLAVVRANVTDEGMQNVQLSPPPGKEAAGTVPSWQIDIFKRPELASSLREKAESFLR